jgi:hypothetical protein
METNFSLENIDSVKAGDSKEGKAGRFRSLTVAALVVIAALGLGGCAGDVYTAGYGPSYYTPDYGSYYSDYGYDGNPYWGSGRYFGGGIIVGGRHHRGSYGGHHFVHQSGGFHTRGPSISRGPSTIRGGGRR